MRYQVLHGDCLALLVTQDANSVDAVVCDPPYDLRFMGKAWDGTGVAFRESTWLAVYRVLKPGGHLLAMGGTRTFHRLTCAIEDAGFEIRDCLSWLYGSGFPKSMNLTGDKAGWGTALKPSWEPIVLARKPPEGTTTANVATWGTGALNIDGCRIPHQDEADRRAAYPQGRPTSKAHAIAAEPDAGRDERRRDFEPSANRRYADQGTTDFAALPGPRGGDPKGRWPGNVALSHTLFCQEQPDGSYMCTDGCPLQILDVQAGTRHAGGTPPRRFADKARVTYNAFPGEEHPDGIKGSTGSAARFFYVAKASRAERDAGLAAEDDRLFQRVNPGGLEHDPRWAPTQVKNHHPTVKPVALFRWLTRLVTPPGGLVLDPFCGSGTTGVACMAEGFTFLGIDQDASYVQVARSRLAYAAPGLEAPETKDVP